MEEKSLTEILSEKLGSKDAGEAVAGTFVYSQVVDLRKMLVLYTCGAVDSNEQICKCYSPALGGGCANQTENMQCIAASPSVN